MDNECCEFQFKLCKLCGESVVLKHPRESLEGIAGGENDDTRRAWTFEKSGEESPPKKAAQESEPRSVFRFG